MKHLILILFCIANYSIIAQDQNIFLDRTFWKTAPDVATVESKIEAGNDPVVKNGSAFDATCYAILENAPLETIKYLLSIAGNPVDKATHDGRNYLFWAAYKGNLELVKHLIDEGSDVELIDDYGQNVLCFTAVGGQLDERLYDLILANGLDVKSTNRSGANALLLLTPSIKDFAIIKYFKQKGLDIHTKDDDGNGMFHYATRKGNVQLMQHLIEIGVDYKSLNDKGENAIIAASSGSRGYTNPLAVYQFLEGLGLEADIVSWEGKTPLHNMAGGTKDKAIFDYFIEKGVNVNQIDQDGNTAFLNAIRGRNYEIAKQLLPMVKDINHTNRRGYSALTYAVMRNSKAAFDFLLQQGADIKVIDAKENSLVYHIFRRYNAKEHRTFEHFVKKAKMAGLRFNDTFEEGNSVAHVAVEKGEKQLLQAAIDLGVDINIKNNNGLTPLHLAAMKATDSELLSLLLKYGADKSILTEFDESAFDLASENEALKANGLDIEFLKLD